MDEAIDNGFLSIKDFFDQNYILIPGFAPKKYHTAYDSYLDRTILAMEDEFLEDKLVTYAVAVDVNGYLPTHNTRYQQPITGDQRRDLVGNRTKRIFNDPVGIRAARNLEPILRQVYQRDTGETMCDISAPIMVKGKHWGGFRIGFPFNKTLAAKADLTTKLYRLASRYSVAYRQNIGVDLASMAKDNKYSEQERASLKREAGKYLTDAQMTKHFPP